MTATLHDVTPKKRPPFCPVLEAAKQLMRQAREHGLSLTVPDGLVKQLTKAVLERALGEELTHHLARNWCLSGQGPATRGVLGAAMRQLVGG